MVITYFLCSSMLLLNSEDVNPEHGTPVVMVVNMFYIFNFFQVIPGLDMI